MSESFKQHIVPALFAGALWLIDNFPVVSNLLGTGRSPGVDIAVIAGAGIINVDIVNIFKLSSMS